MCVACAHVCAGADFLTFVDEDPKVDYPVKQVPPSPIVDEHLEDQGGEHPAPWLLLLRLGVAGSGGSCGLWDSVHFADAGPGPGTGPGPPCVCLGSPSALNRCHDLAGKPRAGGEHQDSSMIWSSMYYTRDRECREQYVL